MSQDVFIASGARTAIGIFGGSLSNQPPSALGAAVIREAMTRAQVDPATVGHVVMGPAPRTPTSPASQPSTVASRKRPRR